MKAYADSSFIVTLYLPQSHTPIATAFTRRHKAALPFNPRHRLEVRNAIRLAVFHEQIDSQECRRVIGQLEADLRDQSLIIHMQIDWVAVLRQAEKLGAAQVEAIGCGSSDLFHIAAAIEWGADRFLTFDERQKKMAKAEGLTVEV